LGSVGKSIDLPTRHLSKLKDGFRHPTCPLSEADPLVSGPGWKSGGQVLAHPCFFCTLYSTGKLFYIQLHKCRYKKLQAQQSFNGKNFLNIYVTDYTTHNMIGNCFLFCQHKKNAAVIVKHTKHQGYKCIYMTHILIAITHVKIKLGGNS